MINVLRKNQKALWIVIALLCIPFIFYFSKSDMSAVRSSDLGHLYGRPVTQIEAQRNVRMFNLARELGMFTYLQDMIAGANSQNEAYDQFVWNRLILRHEVEKLGIAPSGAEVAKVIKTLQPFQGEKGGFDLGKYTDFTQRVLPELGFGEAELEEVVADQLALERLKEIIGLGAQIPEVESRENYERAYGKLSVAVVRVRSDEMEKSVQINDDTIGKYYETHQAELKSEEKRKVSFVAFGLNDEQKKLEGRNRVEVLQKLADGANDFSQALLGQGAQFDQVAAKFQLPIQTTGEFTRRAPDAALSANPQLAETAFQLSQQELNSDPIQAGDGFYILHLAGINEAKPLSLEEARPQIVEALKSQQLRTLVTARGSSAAQVIREALQNGTPVDAALAKTQLPTEKIPPFALADPPPTPEKDKPAPAPDLQMIKRAVAELSPGEASEFIPTQTGGVIAVLEKREAPDPTNAATAKAEFTSRFLQGKRGLVFSEWLKERRREAGVPTPEPAPGLVPMPG